MSSITARLFGMGVMAHVMKHQANVVTREEAGDVVEGEQSAEPTLGPMFKCLLQLPNATSSRPYGKQLDQPAVLFETKASNRTKIVVVDANTLKILAPELTGPDPVEWEVDGDPEPLAPPGRVIGYQAKLKRVSD